MGFSGNFDFTPHPPCLRCRDRLDVADDRLATLMHDNTLDPHHKASKRRRPSVRRSDIRTRKGIVYSAEKCRENGSGSFVPARGKLNALFVKNAVPVACVSLLCLALGGVPPLAVM